MVYDKVNCKKELSDEDESKKKEFFKKLEGKAKYILEKD